jgi:hypothetical protein
MERKNKLMLIAAIGAVVVLVASGVVRAAVSHGAQQEGADSKPAIEKQAESQAAPAGGGASDALLVLRSHTWQADGDAGKTLSFRDGAFVETDSKGAHVSAFEIESSDESSVIAKVVSDGGAEQKNAAISLSGSEGSYSVSSDSFQVAKKYVQGSSSKAAVAVSGVTEPYTTLIDGKTDELSSAVAAYCRDHAPTATGADFDGEVYVDVKGGAVIATFTCNDTARSILSVRYSDGSFSVTG